MGIKYCPTSASFPSAEYGLGKGDPGERLIVETIRKIRCEIAKIGDECRRIRTANATRD